MSATAPKREHLRVVPPVSTPPKLPEDSSVAKAAVKRIAATF
jgi:hypothetical protein